MRRVWYTSDLHLGHRMVAGIRGFASTEEHDTNMVDAWNATVAPDDTVFVLGDIAVGGFGWHLERIRTMNGKKHLIAGNHDPVHPKHSTSEAKNTPAWSETFATIQPFSRRKLHGRTVLLSHYPYMSWGDGPGRGPARDEQYRLPELGELLIHGHTHGAERDHGEMFHVGWDAWGAPVPQETIIDWILTKGAE